MPVKRYDPLIWKPFEGRRYRCAWRKDKGPVGVVKTFLTDLKFCRERARKGYCYDDLADIDSWFVRIMPVMLEEFRDWQIGNPDEEARWSLDEDLGRMIFLFREAAEETCSKQNPYSDEYNDSWDAFEKRFGIMGTGMDADGGTGKGQFPTVHFPDELEEYRPICERYEQAEREIEDYRLRCEQEALKLFAKRFHDLWI